MQLRLRLKRKPLLMFLHGTTVEPGFNEPLFNKIDQKPNDILKPGQSYSKMYGAEPRYNEFLIMTNIIQKPEH